MHWRADGWTVGPLHLGMDDVLEREFESVMDEVLATLPEPMPTVIRLRFYEKMSLEAVGNRLGIKRDRVRQKEAKAMRMLRHPRRIQPLVEWLPYCNERQ